MPFSVRGSIDHLGVFERLMVVKPVIDYVIFLLIKFHIDRLKRLHFKDIISIIQRSFFIVERWEPDPFEMPSISFLSPHHDPHGSPLGSVDWFDDSRNLINKAYCSCDVIEYLYVSDLLPRHRCIFKEFVYGMRRIFESSQKDSFVSAILSA